MAGQEDLKTKRYYLHVRFNNSYATIFNSIEIHSLILVPFQRFYFFQQIVHIFFLNKISSQLATNITGQILHGLVMHRSH